MNGLFDAMMTCPEKFFNATSAVVLIFNADGAFVWINRAGRFLTGYRDDDLSGKSFSSFFSSTGQKKIADIIRLASSGAEPASFDLPLKCADQSIRRFHWNILAMDDGHDRSQKQFVLCGSDIEGTRFAPADFELTTERDRLFFENSGIGMMYIDEDANVTLVNKEFEKLLGYPKADTEGKIKWMALVASEDDLARMKEYHRLRSIDPNLAPHAYNAKLRHRNGDVLDVVVRVTIVPKTTFRLVSFLDMSQERKAQDAIRESEARYRSLVDNIQDGLYRCDLQGNLVFCNPSAARLAGYDRPEEIIGKNIVNDFFFSTSQRDDFLRQLNVHGQVSNYEVMLRHKSGTAVTVSTSSHYFYDAEGKLLGVEGLYTDITQRKQAEDKFSNIFMMAPDGISITRLKDGCILDMNLGFESITGWKREEVIGRDPVDLNFWVDPADRVFLVRELKTGRDVRQKEFRFRCKDQTIRDGVFSARLLQIAGEDYVIFVGQDVTQRRRTEKVLKDKEERLHAITENMPGVVYQFYATDRGECGVSYAHNRMTDIFGLSRESVGSFSAFLERVHADDRDRFLKSIHNAVSTVSPWNFEGRFIKPSGQILWFQGISTPSRYEDRLIFNGVLLDISELKKAEEISRQTEEKFYKVFATTPDCIAVTRLDDGMISDVNMGFQAITGWLRDEVIGRTAKDIDFWVDSAERIRMAIDLQGGRDIKEREFQFRRKDGVVREGMFSARTIRMADELHIIFVMHDITERKATEKTLKDNEARLLGIARNIPGLVFQFHMTGNGQYKLAYISDRFPEFFGLPVKPATFFREFFNRIHQDDRARFVASLQSAMKTETQWTFEGRFVKPSGDIIWFNNLATPVRTGEKVVFNGITLDITERKKMEEMSRQSEEKFYKVFTTTPDCIAITRMGDERIMEVNRGFEEITGWTREEVIGRMSSEIRLWHDQTERRRMIEELKAGRDVLHREAMFRRRDGSVINVIYSARSIHIAGELSIIFVLHDITDLRRLEGERQKLEEQLFQSQKMDAIGQLASGVAHDFNNILTGIQGNASLIMVDYSADHLHYQRLSRIEENVKRGANLTRQLLGFARGGKYEIRTMDVNDLVRKNAQLFTEARKEIEADFQLQTGGYPVDADAGQIDHVLLNIFINAGHAMPGGGNLTIRTANVTLPEKDALAFEIPPGEYVRISISDTGTGMDQATLKRIFEPFFTTKAKQGGTGLGLASAYGIIRNHGGAITVQSEPGCGATFIIYLPASSRQIAGEVREGSNDLISGSGVILLVDDEPLILDTASEMLKMLGYTVFLAPTGQEAVSIYMEKHNVVDLVILDMILPGMNGAQILKLLKEINPDVRVILSSGYSMQGDACEVMDMGCAGFIQKPYSFADLSALVSQSIHSSRKT